LNVLSCFDGISCGRVALKRAGMKVDRYVAYEIDKNAIMVSTKNHPDIERQGSVIDEDFSKYSGFDILMGGSPCQDLSIGNINGEGLEGSRSSLFWDYVRAIKQVKPKHFIFENVASMKQEDKEIITKALGVLPIEINASLVSAQSRKRLYWTNIPNVQQPQNKNINLKDILIDHDYYPIIDQRIIDTQRFTKNYIQCDVSGKGYNSQQDRFYYLTGKISTIRHARTETTVNIYLGDNKFRRLSPREVERCFTLPDDYTKIDGLSDARRMNLCGNGWVVDVVAHILSYI
jgi:site-specific DNA-cytosine methylase